LLLVSLLGPEKICCFKMLGMTRSEDVLPFRAGPLWNITWAGHYRLIHIRLFGEEHEAGMAPLGDKSMCLLFNILEK
jgi:hypothetical protein